MLINESGNYIFGLDGSEIVIGRDKECDISISGVGVSRKHLSIRLGPDSVQLIDLKSTFGVRVNNLPVNGFCRIEDNDQITVGVQSFKVGLTENNLTLIPLNKSNATGISVSVPKEIQIGRDPQNEIYLPHPLVSRVHATVHCDSRGHWNITDHRSANGTFVNGSSVSASPVHEDDIIQVGPYRLQIKGGKLVRCDDHNRIRLDVNDVSVVKKGQYLLDHINCNLPAGEFIAILGPSGAGKSTFVQALTGSLTLDSGEILVNGLPLSRFLHAFSSSIGYLTQDSLLFNELTVEEVFKEQCLLRLPSDSTPAERSARVQEVVELLELKDVMTTGVSRLSGGEARRVDLGIELLSSPGLLFLDEPLAGLDPGLVKRFMVLFRRIADQGHTLILITHTLEQLEFCDRVLFFNKGKIVF
ncbi:MAG: FHA domain-containing protein, partial [Fibrobacter sp.]|nr:FHA domain-containing protein [Fibrobacter sp.]